MLICVRGVAECLANGGCSINVVYFVHMLVSRIFRLSFQVALPGSAKSRKFEHFGCCLNWIRVYSFYRPGPLEGGEKKGEKKLF